MKFWERVDYELEYLGISQKELARIVQISQSAISTGRTRKTTPHADTAIKIANFLHVSVDYLVSGSCGKNEDSLLKYREIIDELEKLSSEEQGRIKKVIIELLKAAREQ